MVDELTWEIMIVKFKLKIQEEYSSSKIYVL